MPMVPEDIMTGLSTFASAGTLDQGKRYLLTEAAGLIKFMQYRVQQAEEKQRDAQRDLAEIKQLNEAVRARMSGMTALQEHFKKQLWEMSKVTLDGRE